MAQKKEKTTHMVKTHSTPIPGISAKINYQNYTDGSVSLSGYLVDRKTGIRHDCDIKATTTAAVSAQVFEREQFLIARMTHAYQAITKITPSVAPTARPYSDVFQSLDDEEKQQLCPRSWRAASTRNQGLAYFSRTMLPLLDSYGLEIGITEKNEILEKMQKLAEANGNYIGNPYTTSARVAQHAIAFNYFYQRLLALRPQCGLPEIVLPVKTSSKHVQAEQCKSLPTEIRVKLAASLMRLISNGLSVGGILMLTAMPRTAEACAPFFRDIVFYENYAVYGVLWQSNGTIKIPDLKSKSAYRVIVLPKFSVCALRMRQQWLRDQGYSDAEINDMPVVASPNDPTVMASPNDLSAFLRDLLSLLGCGKSYWAAVDDVMLKEPDMDHYRKPSRDPSAYVLRRNGCTMCCNICGMDSDLVDALMGHKLSRHCRQRWDRYIRRPENWPIIAEQLERVIYDPRYSANPAFLPIILHDGNQYISKCAQIRFCIMADPESSESLEIDLVADSLEAGDSIVLDTPNRGSRGHAHAFGRDEDAHIPILGDVRAKSDYMKYIQEVDSLDLSPYLPHNTQKKEESQ